MAPLLALDLFRKQMNYNPWHFHGFANSTKAPRTSSANTVLKQYAWQSVDEIGRDEILKAIETAEYKLTQLLRYSPAPHYITDDEITHPRPADHRNQYAGSIDSNGQWLSVQLKEGYIIQAGIEARTLIDDAVAVTYSDADGDGVNDTFTLSVVTSVTDPTQIAVYFASADRIDGADVSEEWRIQPVQVSISGGTATIKGRAWLLGKPIKTRFEGDLVHPDLDPNDSTNFVTTLDVYRRYTNPDGTTTATSQGKFLWETAPYPGYAICCGCAGSSTDPGTDPAALAESIARIGLRDAKHGVVSVGAAVYNASTAIWSSAGWTNCAQPARVLVRYQAGIALVNQQMHPDYQTIVAHLAAAELTERANYTDRSGHWLFHWQFDLARSAGANDEQYSISPEDLNGPFGTKRGQVDAWKRVKHLFQTRGFLP